MLDIHQLSLTIDDHPILDKVDVKVDQGKLMALVGESGSGKSLTALSILKLLPDGATMQGSIHFKGEELTKAPEERLRQLRGNRIGIIFQEPMTALNPLHTIEKQLRESLHIHKRYKEKEIIPRIHTLLEEVGLKKLKNRLDAYPHQLSGGERQRVMIAMAIANEPELLIADEPTTALDVTVQLKILQLLKKLQRERQLSILFITHDLHLVSQFADNITVLKAGKVVETGACEALLHRPRHAYTKALLDAIPRDYTNVEETTETLLKTEALRVHFPIKKGVLRRTKGYVKAVNDIDLHLHTGNTLGIVGESGSGKTTLGLALLKLTLSEGSIVYAGQEISHYSRQKMRALRSDMQFVFQDPYSSLNPRMTIERILMEGLHLHQSHLSLKEKQTAVESMLRRVGLTPAMKYRHPHAFSGGQRQRIGIARAMILQPKCVVLDEPTSALDVTTQAQILGLLKHFQREDGVSYIFISHDLRVVRAIAHQIMVMRHGDLIEYGTTKEILQQPKDAYTKALVKAAMLRH